MLVVDHTEYPIHSDAYRRASVAMKVLDDVAEALIGDRQHFVSQRVYPINQRAGDVRSNDAELIERRRAGQ